MMLRYCLIGMIAGLRSMTPLAALSFTARYGTLVPAAQPPKLLAAAALRAAAVTLAAGEMLGDKLPFAPDRISRPGVAARLTTGAFAAAALAPRGERLFAAAIGGTTAIAAGYLSFAVRRRSISRYGQTRTGVVEDVAAMIGAALIVAT